jgi:hypothetical protein
MKTIKILALSVLLVTGINAKAFAGAAEFSGPYIGVNGSAVGAAIDGKFTDGTSNARTTKGTAGAVSPTVGVEAGWSIAISDVFFITLNATSIPFDASFKADDAVSADDVTVTMSDMIEVNLEPSFAVTSNSAIFLSVGRSEFELKASGTGLDATQKFDLTGDSFGMGTKTITDGGLYIKTEVGMTDYDGFTLAGVGTNDGTAVISGIETAYGAITIGKKF